MRAKCTNCHTMKRKKYEEHHPQIAPESVVESTGNLLQVIRIWKSPAQDQHQSIEDSMP